MSAPPDVAILLRCYNDVRYLTQALDSVDRQDYVGNLHVYVGLDMGSTDGTAALIRDRLGWSTMSHDWQVQPLGKMNRRWFVLVHPHMTLAAATRYLLPRILAHPTIQRVLLLDADNYLDPNAVSRRVARHPGAEAPGLCAAPIRWGTNEGAPPFPIVMDGPIDGSKLLEANFIDTLNPIWRADYLRERLLPRLQHTDPGDLVDDYLFNLLAAQDGQADFHWDTPDATYRFRKGSLTERTDVGARTDQTKQAFVAIGRAEGWLK